MKRIIVGLLVFISSASIAHADECFDLDATLDRLMQILPGEFDSEAQLKAEQISNTPEDMRHIRVYRSFTQIDVPEIGKNVLVIALRYDDGPDGMIDMNEFQVWTLEVDEENQAVKMWPRRFKDPQAYTEITRDVEALNKLQALDLGPSDGAAGCPIYWRPVSELIHGTVSKPCLGPTRIAGETQILSWEWTYLLDDKSLWMSFAGRNDAGEIIFGRQDQLPWRMDKVN